MDTVINTLTFWAVQNGALTCFVAVASLICWLTMPNLIFLGLHLIITKLYANALLATLNARKSIRLHQSSKDCDSMPVVTTPNFNRGLGHNHHVITSQSIPMTKVQINVDRTIETQSDQEPNKGGI
ncbi:hypothetical protein AcW2_000007 [Taiwanofungus camphoratus]|nr:hypothetical protein AcW2_000007 [Antrodia cinnamomea]